MVLRKGASNLEMNLDQFTDFADSFVNDEVPPALLHGLNLGIVVLPEEKEEGEFYIMGEYITEELGCHVVLYYGSFVKTLRGEPRAVWEENIKETIKHELQHHLEALAGDEKLARKEMEEELESLQMQEESKSKDSSPSGYSNKLFTMLLRILKKD